MFVIMVIYYDIHCYLFNWDILALLPPIILVETLTNTDTEPYLNSIIIIITGLVFKLQPHVDVSHTLDTNAMEMYSHAHNTSNHIPFTKSTAV